MERNCNTSVSQNFLHEESGGSAFGYAEANLLSENLGDTEVDSLAKPLLGSYFGAHSMPAEFSSVGLKLHERASEIFLNIWGEPTSQIKNLVESMADCNLQVSSLASKMEIEHKFGGKVDLEKPECSIEVEWSTHEVENAPWKPAGNLNPIPDWRFNVSDGRWYCEFGNCGRSYSKKWDLEIHRLKAHQMHRDYKLPEQERGRKSKVPDMPRRKRNFEQVRLKRSADEDYLF